MCLCAVHTAHRAHRRVAAAVAGLPRWWARCAFATLFSRCCCFSTNITEPQSLMSSDNEFLKCNYGTNIFNIIINEQAMYVRPRNDSLHCCVNLAGLICRLEKCHVDGKLFIVLSIWLINIYCIWELCFIYAYLPRIWVELKRCDDSVFIFQSLDVDTDFTSLFLV